MCSVPTEVEATERARWLADVAEALEEARRLLLKLNLDGERLPVARELHLRIEAARLEVQSLRLSRSLQSRPQSAPEWTESLPWQSDEGSCR